MHDKSSKQKSILCYGDSNTWGYVPLSSHDASQSILRYSRKERWTGILQSLLGDDYYVIEEGLNSRTTNIDYSKLPNRNGKTYLPSCLYSHAPIDLVVIALGGNDVKTYFNRTPEQITEGLRELVSIVQSSFYGEDMKSAPKTLIIPPPLPLPIAETHLDENGVAFFKGGIDKIEKLPKLYKQLAESVGCEYLDLSREVVPSEVDGVHFGVEMHAKFAKSLSEIIQKILISS